jgi:hypothetical protein
MEAEGLGGTCEGDDPQKEPDTGHAKHHGIALSHDSAKPLKRRRWMKRLSGIPP